MSLPSLVLFDCDGVLVDSERLTHCVLREMIAEFGVDLTLEQTLDHFMGTSTEKELEVLASLIGHAVPADFGDRFNARSFEAFTSSLEPVPGVPQLLASLQLPCCVASNGLRKKMRFTLGHTGLLPFFEGRLFSAQDVKTPKPAPDLFLHAAAAPWYLSGWLPCRRRQRFRRYGGKAGRHACFWFCSHGPEGKTEPSWCAFSL